MTYTVPLYSCGFPVPTSTVGIRSARLTCRNKGDVQWKLIAVRKRKFPFYDEAPLAVPGQPEVREYMAIGVVADEEVGQPSEIKEVVYAG